MTDKTWVRLNDGTWRQANPPMPNNTCEDRCPLPPAQETCASCPGDDRTELK